MKIDESNKLESTRAMIYLDKGEADVTIIPVGLLSDASQQTFTGTVNSQTQLLCGYGAKTGYSPLRHHLADFLQDAYCDATLSFENICITAGISAMLDQICTMFLRPGDTVLVENPTYMFAFNIFRDHHLNIVSCETDDNGLILGPTFITNVIEKTKPKMIYIVPTFQNPAGSTMPLNRREELVQLSVKYNFLIVADEAYHLLDYEKEKSNNHLVQHSKSFAVYRAAGNVISLNSFSKILAPGLRLGFACASREHVQAMIQFGLTQSGGVANPLISSMVGWIVVNGFLKKYIDETLCVEFGKRLQVLHATLMETFTDKLITCRLPSGGYFLWIKFNDTAVDCDQLLVYCLKYGVIFKPGRVFAYDADAKAKLSNCLRLSITFGDCEELKEGCARLKQGFDEYKSNTFQNLPLLSS